MIRPTPCLLLFSRCHFFLYCCCLPGLAALFFTNTIFASDSQGLKLQCPDCNVIFLNIELLRPEFVGLLGGGSLTPNLDRFFSKSIIFHDVTAPAGETFLSNTAVLTVTPTHKINIRPLIIDRLDREDAQLQDEIKQQLTTLTSVASILNNTGYKTISINQGGRAGKNVFLDRGFDEFSQWSSDLLFDDMLELLQHHLSKIENQKFFLLFRSTYLHNHQYRRPVNSEITSPRDVRVKSYSYVDGFGRKKNGILLKTTRKQAEKKRQQLERDIYTGQVEYGDIAIKKLFDSLGDDLLKKTIIVLYANHGTGLGDNNIYNHGTAYQSAVSVPLLIRIPGLDQAIHVYEPVALLSLVPSILGMLNIKAEHMFFIETYDQVISGLASKDRVFYGRNGFDEFIRFNNWKYMVKYGRFPQLFNLKSDPGERSNLLDKEPVMSRKLAAMLLQYKTKLLKSEPK